MLDTWEAGWCSGSPCVLGTWEGGWDSGPHVDLHVGHLEHAKK